MSVPFSYQQQLQLSVDSRNATLCQVVLSPILNQMEKFQIVNTITAPITHQPEIETLGKWMKWCQNEWNDAMNKQ